MENNLDEKKLTPEQRAAKAPDAAVQKPSIKDRLRAAFRVGLGKDKKVVAETIHKVKGGYRLVAGSGRNLGTYPTKGGAENRERQVNYFKHVKEETAQFKVGDKVSIHVPDDLDWHERKGELLSTSDDGHVVKLSGGEKLSVTKHQIKKLDEVFDSKEGKETLERYKKKASNVKRALPSLTREFQRKIEKAEALAAQHSPGGKLPRGVGRNPAIAAKAREEAAKAKKSLAVFDRWHTNRTKGLERAEKRLEETTNNSIVKIHVRGQNVIVHKWDDTAGGTYKEVKHHSSPRAAQTYARDLYKARGRNAELVMKEAEQIDELSNLSKSQQDQLSTRAKQHQHIANAAHEVGDFETANQHNNHASRIYDHLIKRNMHAIKKNLRDMQQMRSGGTPPKNKPKTSNEEFHVEMHLHPKKGHIIKVMHGPAPLDEVRENEPDVLDGQTHKMLSEFKPSSYDHDTITREFHKHLEKHGYYSAAKSHPLVESPEDQKAKNEILRKTTLGGMGKHEGIHQDSLGNDSSRYVTTWSSGDPTKIYSGKTSSTHMPNATKTGHPTLFDDSRVYHSAPGGSDRWFVRASEIRKIPEGGIPSEARKKKKSPDRLKDKVGKWHKIQLARANLHMSNAAEAEKSGNRKQMEKHLEKAARVVKKHKETLDWLSKNYPEYHPAKTEEVSEGIGAMNRALGLKPYGVLNPPPKRKPGLLKKIKNKIKDKLGIYEAVRKPEHTHAVVRQGNVLSYHKSSKSAHRRADRLDLDYGAVAHSVRRLEPL